MVRKVRIKLHTNQREHVDEAACRTSITGRISMLSLIFCKFLVDAVRCILVAVHIHMHPTGYGPVPHVKWSDQHVPVYVTFGIKWRSGRQTAAT